MRLADELGITVDAAKELMRLHEAAFPDVWGYLERSGKLAKAHARGTGHVWQTPFIPHTNT